MDPGSRKKLSFACDVVANPVDYGSVKTSVKEEVVRAMTWVEQRTPAQRCSEREAIIDGIEARAQELDAESWFGDADVHIRQISNGVNGALAQELLSLHQYPDVDSFDVFRDGGRMVDQLARSGVRMERRSNDVHACPEQLSVVAESGQQQRAAAGPSSRRGW